MSYQPKILAFAGALRKDSTNKKTVKVAVEGARKAGAEVTLIDLKDFPVPLYDGDIESSVGIPENAVKLQELMREHDGFLIASPEYNSGIPGTLKTYIDWTSRPHSEHRAGASYGGKVVIIMSASPGALGGLRGLIDLRKVLSTMGVIVLPNEFAVSKSHEAFNEDGSAKVEFVQNTLEGLGKTLTEFLIKLNS
ncbi:MAG TPA: NAD(P)H-dependent oxidoreductase [Pyrinomonadaceae bacterium]|nr:NAD(P)H-dependent oxidoreductase [Pyrinomonadaceae bacterium]